MWKSTSFCLRLFPHFQLIPPLPSLSGKTADMPNTDNLPTNSLLTTALSPHKRYAGSLNHQEIALPGICYLLLAIAGFCTDKELKLPAISGTRDGNFKRINTLLPQNPIKSCINFSQEFIKQNKKYFIPNLGKKKKKAASFNYSVENSRKCFPPPLIGHLGFLVVFWKQTSLLKMVPDCSTSFMPICICPVASFCSLDEVHASIEISVTVQETTNTDLK